MQVLDLSKFNVIIKNLPVNIYGVRILDTDNNRFYDAIITHNGNCPNICNEREQSNYNDYLSNLESIVISNFLKTTPLNNYSQILEVMTNEKGDLYHFARSTH